MIDGFLLVDKSAGLTSHDVVARVRRRFGTKRVGHAGTLDPMATGVLVLGIGNATKLLQYVVDGSKAYDAVIRLGSSTVTDDREGEVVTTASAMALAEIDDGTITRGLERMVGVISQRPSNVSAIKVGGKTAHQRVREGEVFELPSREVTIEEILVTSISRSPGAIDIEVSVRCSAGTYIRAIARDLGEELGVGGHLTALRRTLVSPFALDECADWESAELLPTANSVGKILPTRTLTEDELAEIGFGRVIDPSQSEGVVAALTPQGYFAGLLLNKEQGKKLIAAPTMVAARE